MNLSKVPHKKVKYGEDTYYIARYPEGDAHIHKANRYDQNGYGGRTIKFLLDDGTVEKVKGPYCCDGLFDFGIGKKLAEYLNDPSLNNPTTKLIVGNNLFLGKWGGKEREVLFEEADFVQGDYRKRIKSEWIDFEIEVCTRGGSFYISPNDMVKRKKNEN